jgi:TRAP-type mannitol/chloroaromatic compound transport system permease large subunit
MGVDPVWLGIMIALNLQTSFLTPPFGFSLFYLRGVAPESVKTEQIYQGVIPFILIQLGVLGLVAYWPELATWLPNKIYG